ncbi:MAG: GH3 auxin-responsive promoter family protein [Bacteroidota bacterium]
MGIKATLSKPFAKYITRNIKKWSLNPIQTQEKVFRQLINSAKNTAFGKDHNFDQIKTYASFKKNVPIRDYEGIRHYIDRIIAGEKDVLWNGKPIYFCKTSGTTSGAKYIPITRESMPNHINSARNALLSYISETGKADFVNGKMIFLQGSPKPDKIGDIPLGRLSGIVANHVPSYLLKNRMPSYQTNCIEDWETKVDAIVEETLKENMTLISGIPSWVQMYFDKLLEKTGKENIMDIFPNFSLFVYGGVNYEPYRANFENTIGKKIDAIELYPASEGFIAFQDSQKEKGLLLILNSGIFYEFIPADEFFNDDPKRISLKDIELGVNYAIILNTNAGLWGYNIGDTIKFVSKNPYRLIVTGRISHYISAFGEHVIAEEVEDAIQKASEEEKAEIIEFHVAPQVNPKQGLPYHEWFIEFGKIPGNPDAFRLKIDKAMQERNIYYRDLITGNVLQPLIITPVKKDGFIEYMRSQGKLGGQNKVPRLSDDREIADELGKFAE